MKKVIFFSLIAATLMIAACDKGVNLPAYTPPTTNNFSVTALNHTADSVNIGDTLYLVASGTIADTASFISDTSKSVHLLTAYLTSSFSAYGVSQVQSFGSASSPIALKIAFGPQNSAGQFTWTSTIELIGATTTVPHKTKLTIAASFIYQLTLSSQLGTLTASDGGIAGAAKPNKTIYVR
jgi:hypothetical protein